MKRTCGHRHKLARVHDDFPVGKFDNKLPVHAKESLVGIRMPMPAKLLGHNTHANFVIIHFTERVIPVSLAHCPA